MGEDRRLRLRTGFNAMTAEGECLLLLDGSLERSPINTDLCREGARVVLFQAEDDFEAAWLKAPGKGYQTRMNAILRKAMLADLKPGV